jgi:PEP-CTERM motif
MERVGIPPNIAAAIRRSQDARSELRSRRRRFAAIIAGLCVAIAVPVSLSFTDFNANGVVQAAVTKAQSLVDMLAKRSPGQRTEAQLTKTKHKQRALAKQRSLPRKPPIAPLVSSLVPMPVELASILMPPPELLPPPVAQLVGPPPTLGGIVSPPGNSVIVPPGSDTPVSNPTPQPREPIVVPPAVPEPGTWLTMLLGFGLIGWRIRRGKASGFTKLRTA